ncbi:MAG: hypothetical protein ACRCYU_12345 [Nocardioides sp.]
MASFLRYSATLRPAQSPPPTSGWSWTPQRTSWLSSSAPTSASSSSQFDEVLLAAASSAAICSLVRRVRFGLSTSWSTTFATSAGVGVSSASGLVLLSVTLLPLS